MINKMLIDIYNNLRKYSNNKAIIISNNKYTYFEFSQIIGIPSKADFTKNFIEVASKGNPTIGSIISETVRANNMFGGFGFGVPEPKMAKRVSATKRLEKNKNAANINFITEFLNK